MSTPSFRAYALSNAWLGIDEGSDAARFLRLGDRMNRERRLARRLGTEYLSHPALGVASDAERLIDRNRSRRNNRDLVDLLALHLHDRTLAEVLFDLVLTALST